MNKKLTKKEKRAKQKEIMELLDQYFQGMKETSELVDPIIISYFKESLGRICRDDKIYQKLYEAAMGRLGKPKMRSWISRMGYEICSGKNLEGFLPIAVAMDLLEFSYYCSDVIFDTELYNNREATEDKIIVSNILVSIVFKLISDSIKKLDLGGEQSSEILSSTYTFIRDIYEGFFIENHNKEPSKEIYERRTYAYNYWEHILRISAMVADADKKKIEALSNFGKYIGMAYMVTNDISDITKDFEDIRYGRYTLPNIVFLEKADNSERKLFLKVFGGKTTDKKNLKKIGQIMVDKKVVEECQLYASCLVEKALPHLKIFKDSHWKRMLAIATGAVYKNQWYRSMSKIYGFQRTVIPADLKLAGIKI